MTDYSNTEIEEGQADIGKYGKLILFAIREAETPLSAEEVAHAVGGQEADILATVGWMVDKGLLEEYGPDDMVPRLKEAGCDFTFYENDINVIADSIWIDESRDEPCICMDCNAGEYITYSTEKDIERFIEVLEH